MNKSASCLMYSLLVLSLACSGGGTTPTVSPHPEGSAQTAGAGSAAAGDAPSELTLPVLSCAPTAFKRIPSPITKNTLVEDNCLEVRGAVRVNPGVSLIIIAKRQLRFGSGSSIDARGDKGTQGPPASLPEEKWEAQEPNRGEKIACACQGRSCRDGWGACSPSGNAGLRGGKGNAGSAAANVHIVAYELTGATNAKILASGGDGGEPGQSGHVHCWENSPNGLQCNSGPAPSNGAGDPGANGTARYEAGTKTADTQMKDLVAATQLRAPGTPTPTTHIVDTSASFRQAVSDARAEGHTYDNVSGQ